MASEQQIYDALRSAAAVTAVCGDRIYPDSVPQDKTLPAIAFVRAGTEFATTIHAVTTTMRSRATVEIWALATTRKAADQLAAAAQLALIPIRFNPVDRRAEKAETNTPEDVYATVLTYQFWE
jgi:hypothetical protein